jgi:chromosomal replication initiator protein
MNKEDNTKIPIGELTDIIDKCKGFIQESTLIIKNIEQNQAIISYPIPAFKIIKLVKDEFKIDFTLRKRKPEIVSARYACAYLLKRFTKLTLIEIAEYINVRDHSTVLHAIKSAKNWMETNRQYNLTIKKLENQLWEYHNELHDNNI